MIREDEQRTIDPARELRAHRAKAAGSYRSADFWRATACVTELFALYHRECERAEPPPGLREDERRVLDFLAPQGSRS